MRGLTQLATRIQISFFRQLCHLKRTVTPNTIFREFSEGPWLEKWWSFLLGFMRRLSLLPEGSLHLDILRDNIADAKGPLPCANWAQGIDTQFASLGIASPRERKQRLFPLGLVLWTAMAC